MLKSESIAQLADALSKAQGEMESAKKDSDNPFFKSKYADLASVWDACRGPLTRHGLSVVQMPETAENGGLAVHTILLHNSGEWISSVLSMKPVDEKPQTAGSCITYMRRYSLSAAAGIAPEDDDGNQASGKSTKTTEAPRTIAAPKVIKVEKPDFEPLPPLEELVAKAEQKAGPELIDRGRVVNFNKSFREALPAEFRPRAEDIRHAWLGDQMILKDGNPSAEGIKMSEFEAFKAKACLFAKEYAGEMSTL